MPVNRIPDISKFPDCCALSEWGRCRSLTLYCCQSEQCTFKQTKQEETDSLKNAYERLASLDLPIQVQIAKRYCGGLMPWNEEYAMRKSRSCKGKNS